MFLQRLMSVITPVMLVSQLNAIRWVAMAWSLVEEETIRKCFRKAGILNIGCDCCCM